MIKIICHNISQQAELYHIKSSKEYYKYDIVYYLKECSVCNKPAILIKHVGFDGCKTPAVRLKKKNIPSFLAKMKIIYKEEYKVSEFGTNKPYYYYWAVEGNKQVEKTLDNYATGRELCTIVQNIA